MNIVEKVYTDRDNIIQLKFYSGGELFTDLENATRIVLSDDTETVTFDSDELGFGEDDVFDVATTPGTLILRFGDLGEDLPDAGSYYLTIYVYSVDNTNGIRWDDFKLKII